MHLPPPFPPFLRSFVGPIEVYIFFSLRPAIPRIRHSISILLRTPRWLGGVVVGVIGTGARNCHEIWRYYGRSAVMLPVDGCTLRLRWWTHGRVLVSDSRGEEDPLSSFRCRPAGILFFPRGPDGEMSAVDILSSGDSHERGEPLSRRRMKYEFHMLSSFTYDTLWWYLS